MQIKNEDLKELEFPELLSEIAQHAFTEKVHDLITHLKPLDEPKAREALMATSEFLSAYQSENHIPFSHYEAIENELKHMLIENFRLENKSFLKIKNISVQIAVLQRFFLNFELKFPVLNKNIRTLTYKKEIVDKIDAVFNRFAEVKNEASPELFTIRGEIASIKKRIEELFTKTLNYFAKQDLLDDIRETVVDDQRVLAVKSTFKKRVPGRTLGISKTGSITYILPEKINQLYYQLSEQQELEKNEVDKILRKLTTEINVFHEDLTAYQNYLFELDLTQAKATFANRIDAVLPIINNVQKLKLINAYHPLLLIRNRLEKKEIFSQSFSLSTEQRIMCISGPNAGGKSITLKTLGLLQLMLQSGILVTVHPKSEFFFFKKIMTDIGDNQSIENHLSTYSSRLKKMASIIRSADSESLLLIDEFGTGSDPELGGALAESFLEFFYKNNAFSVITTHYSNIKILVEQLPAAINAAMLFDEESFEPLYKLEIGQAGSSFTFEVAEKNKIPPFIIQSAKKKIEKEVVNLDKTIVKLQQEKFEVEKLKSRLSENRQILDNKKVHTEKLNEQLQQKLFNFQKLYEEEHRKLQFGTKIQDFIKAYTNGISRKDVVKNFVKLLEQEKYKATDTDKQQIDKLKIIKKKITTQLKNEELIKKNEEVHQIIETKKQEERNLWLKPGQRVRIIGSTSVGTIEKISKNKAIINYGTFKTTINTDELERI